MSDDSFERRLQLLKHAFEHGAMAGWRFSDSMRDGVRRRIQQVDAPAAVPARRPWWLVSLGGLAAAAVVVLAVALHQPGDLPNAGSVSHADQAAPIRSGAAAKPGQMPLDANGAGAAGGEQSEPKLANDKLDTPETTKSLGDVADQGGAGRTGEAEVAASSQPVSRGASPHAAALTLDELLSRAQLAALVEVKEVERDGLLVEVLRPLRGDLAGEVYGHLPAARDQFKAGTRLVVFLAPQTRLLSGSGPADYEVVGGAPSVYVIGSDWFASSALERVQLDDLVKRVTQPAP